MRKDVWTVSNQLFPMYHMFLSLSMLLVGFGAGFSCPHACSPSGGWKWKTSALKLSLYPHPGANMSKSFSALFTCLLEANHTLKGQVDTHIVACSADETNGTKWPRLVSESD